jgi:hypothetical protein
MYHDSTLVEYQNSPSTSEQLPVRQSDAASLVKLFDRQAQQQEYSGQLHSDPDKGIESGVVGLEFAALSPPR